MRLWFGGRRDRGYLVLRAQLCRLLALGVVGTSAVQVPGSGRCRMPVAVSGTGPRS